jgi:methylenetetrahydrofolate reductase (NADPH)
MTKGREPMSFQKRLSAGEFVVLAEMNTPKGVDTSQLVNEARRLKGRVDAVTVPDMDNGIMRMSALAGGALLNQQGIEPILHVYCRDRNRMALQGDVLAAYGLGIQNLIVVGSEDVANCDHQDIKTVNDLDELGLIGAICMLSRGVDLAGLELDGTPSFSVGCTMAPWADEGALDREIEVTRQKVAAGARFVVTPPAYDVNLFAGFVNRAQVLGVPIIATVFLLKSVGSARYIASTEPAAGLSEDLIRRIRKASDRETECLKIAGETAAALKNLAQGVRFVTLGWEHRLPAILDYAGL